LQLHCSHQLRSVWLLSLPSLTHSALGIRMCTEYGYCVLASDATPAHANWVEAAEPNGAPPVLCAPPPKMWLASAFWMLQLISGTAGGPVDEDTFSTSEQVVFYILVICACLTFAFLLGRFCDVLSNLSPEKTLFRQRMDHLNRWISFNDFDTETAIALRTYMYTTKYIQVSRSNRELMELFSPKLRGDAALVVHRDLYRRVPFFQGIEENALETILQKLEPLVLVPRERAETDAFYYISSGTVLFRGFMVGAGSSWGADCVLADPKLRRFAGRAITYTEVHLLTRNDILSVCELFPLAGMQVRWAAVRLALIRYLLDIGIERDVQQSRAARAIGAGSNASSFCSHYEPPASAPLPPRAEQHMVTPPSRVKWRELKMNSLLSRTSQPHTQLACASLKGAVPMTSNAGSARCSDATADQLAHLNAKVDEVSAMLSAIAQHLTALQVDGSSDAPASKCCTDNGTVASSVPVMPPSEPGSISRSASRSQLRHKRRLKTTTAHVMPVPLAPEPAAGSSTSHIESSI